MEVTAKIRRYGLAAYWVLFAAYTMYMAREPGLMLHPEQWTYPWASALAVCAVLAVLVTILHAILRPVSYRRSWGRLICALIYSVALVGLGLATVATDMPGHAYVPGIFSLATLLLVVILGAAQIVVALWVNGAARGAPRAE